MKLLSYWLSTGRSAGPKIEGHGELIAVSGDRVTIRCRDSGKLVNVHKNNTTAEPTLAEIAAHCEVFQARRTLAQRREAERYEAAEVPLVLRTNHSPGRYL
jgi:hypothetical protein